MLIFKLAYLSHICPQDFFSPSFVWQQILEGIWKTRLCWLTCTKHQVAGNLWTFEELIFSFSLRIFSLLVWNLVLHQLLAGPLAIYHCCQRKRLPISSKNEGPKSPKNVLETLYEKTWNHLWMFSKWSYLRTHPFIGEFCSWHSFSLACILWNFSDLQDNREKMWKPKWSMKTERQNICAWECKGKPDHAS